MKTIVRALPAVVGAFILGELAHAESTATVAHRYAIGIEAALVTLAALGACVLLVWLTRGKRRQRRSQRRPAPYSYRTTSRER